MAETRTNTADEDDDEIARWEARQSRRLRRECRLVAGGLVVLIAVATWVILGAIRDESSETRRLVIERTPR